jgi:omega-6 fatty acid desaturase / acyl-lipid omega-6 desaturase (Delta-12 desaturase)
MCPQHDESPGNQEAPQQEAKPIDKSIDDPLPSIGSIRAAVPKHCFERSILRSMYYLIRDSTIVFLIGFGAYFYLPMDNLFNPAQILMWIVFAVVQGTAMTGLWVVGHECGHGAFSSSRLLNDLIGYPVHTMLLVPYWAWAQTHATHHSRVNHLLDGESHVPSLKSKVFPKMAKMANSLGEDAFTFMEVVNHLVFGWPAYLFAHITGSKRNPRTKERYVKKPNHFDPRSSNELFGETMQVKIFFSTLGVISMVGALVYLGTIFGFKTVGLMYLGPYMVVNSWLVGYTWLHHMHEDVPQYGEDEWTWLKGALCTIDRPYPWYVDEMHHHIGSTHVAHHLFHEMPHYHAQEATEALKGVLGKHYRFDSMPVSKALWRTANRCHYVDQLDGVQYMRSVFDDINAEKKSKKL